jgi:hypothetical protein
MLDEQYHLLVNNSGMVAADDMSPSPSSKFESLLKHELLLNSDSDGDSW